MTFDANVKSIKKLVLAITGKDSDVSLTYKGTAYGVTKPWHLRCETREINHETFDGAARELLAQLKQELEAKISSTERQAAEYRQVLSGMAN